MALEIRIKTNGISALAEALEDKADETQERLNDGLLYRAALQFMIDRGADHVELINEEGADGEDAAPIVFSAYGFAARFKPIELALTNVEVARLKAEKSILDVGRSVCHSVDVSVTPVADLQTAARRSAKRYLAIKEYLGLASPNLVNHPVKNEAAIQTLDTVKRRTAYELARRSERQLAKAQLRAENARIPPTIRDAALISGFMQGGVEVEITDEANAFERLLLTNAYRIFFEE